MDARVYTRAMPDDPPISVAYDVGPRDLRSAAGVLIERDPSMRQARSGAIVGAAVLLTLGAMVFAGSFWPAPGFRESLLRGIALAFAVAAAIMLRVRSAQRKLVLKSLEKRDHSAVFGATRITLTDDGLLDEGRLITTHYRPGCFNEIAVTDEQVCLIRKDTQIVLVPARAFADRAAAEAFAERARRVLVRDTRPDAAPPPPAHPPTSAHPPHPPTAP